MQKLTRVLVFSLLLLSLAVAAFAQTETGQIAGTVKDKTGAVVANAKVTVTAVDTNVSRTGTTNASGIYTFPALKPAAYKVTIEAPGFQKFERRLEVFVSSNNDVSAVLSVLGSATVVEVSADAQSISVNTENQTISTVITTADLENLPTDANRNPYALVGQASNASEDSNSARGAGYALNGARSASTSVLLDGAENVDAYTASVGQVVPLDSVQEFSVLTSNFGAEYGRASGGVVNLVTKSGTNTLHGSAYEFNRISALSSNTFYNDANGVERGHYTRNNFGFSVGGPIIKNKLFFFDNLEWIRVRSSGGVQAYILDPGSYSSISTGGQTFMSTYGANIASGVKTLSNMPCNSGVNPITHLPNPGNNLTCDLVTYNVPVDAGGGTPENTWDEVGKIDFNLSPKTNISGRYAGYHEIDTAGSNNNSPYAGYNTGQNIFNQNIALSLTHIFSPRVVSSSKVVYNRMFNLQPLGTAPVGPTLYTTGAVPSVPGGSQPLVFPGYLNESPGNAIPFGGPQNLIQLYQDFSVTWNKHQIKFGGQVIQLRDNRTFGAYENAVEELGKNYNDAMGNLTTANGGAGAAYLFEAAINPQGEYPCYRDLHTGDPIQTPACTLTTPVGAPSFERNYRYNDGAAYIQDTYKVSSRLTINGGVRWEYYGVQHNADPSKDSNFVMGPGANPWEKIRNGQVELAKNGGYFWKPNYGNFGPRAGFAWDPTGTGKTSVRGGWSLGFERNFGNVTYNAIQNPPNYGVVSIQGEGADVSVLPIYTSNAGPLAGSGIQKAFPGVSLRAINQNMKTAYLESYNLGVEQKLFNNALFTIQYVGSHGIHDYSISNANVNGDGGTYLGDSGIYVNSAGKNYNDFNNRLNQQYTNMNYRSDDAYSHYNALVTTFKANNIHKTGVSAYATYTWGHTLDNLSSTFSDGTATLYAATGYLDTWNPKLNYGNADYDIRHRLVGNASWDLPFFKNSSNLLAKDILGGWIVSDTFSFRSGNPYTIWDCDNAIYDCPFYAPGAGAPKLPKGSVGAYQGGGVYNYLTVPMDPNPNPITGVPAGYAYGLANSLGIPSCAGLYHQGCVYTLDGTRVPDRNQFRGPNVWNTNLQFIKNVKLYDKYALQFRAEFYNLLNHHNQYIYNYNLDVSGSQQGTPFAIQTIKGGSGSANDDHRNVDLGVRFSF